MFDALYENFYIITTPDKKSEWYKIGKYVGSWEDFNKQCQTDLPGFIPILFLSCNVDLNSNVRNCLYLAKVETDIDLNSMSDGQWFKIETSKLIQIVGECLGVKDKLDVKSDSKDKLDVKSDSKDKLDVKSDSKDKLDVKRLPITQEQTIDDSKDNYYSKQISGIHLNYDTDNLLDKIYDFFTGDILSETIYYYKLGYAYCEFDNKNNIVTDGPNKDDMMLFLGVVRHCVLSNGSAYKGKYLLMEYDTSHYWAIINDCDIFGVVSPRPSAKIREEFKKYVKLRKLCVAIRYMKRNKLHAFGSENKNVLDWITIDTKTQTIVCSNHYDNIKLHLLYEHDPFINPINIDECKITVESIHKLFQSIPNHKLIGMVNKDKLQQLCEYFGVKYSPYFTSSQLINLIKNTKMIT